MNRSAASAIGSVPTVICDFSGLAAAAAEELVDDAPGLAELLPELQALARIPAAAITATVSKPRGRANVTSTPWRVRLNTCQAHQAVAILDTIAGPLAVTLAAN